MLINNNVLTVNKAGSAEGSNKWIKIFGKPKTRTLFKSQKISKFKKLSKNKNSLKFNTIETRSNFLTFNNKTYFNYLLLISIKTLIF